MLLKQQTLLDFFISLIYTIAHILPTIKYFWHHLVNYTLFELTNSYSLY